MKYLLPFLLILTSCVTIQNHQNWDDDIAMQEECQRITDSRVYSWKGDTITITEPN